MFSQNFINSIFAIYIIFRPLFITTLINPFNNIIFHLLCLCSFQKLWELFVFLIEEGVKGFLLTFLGNLFNGAIFCYFSDVDVFHAFTFDAQASLEAICNV